MRIINILLPSLLLFASFSRANTDNDMRCSDLGLFWGDCRLNARTLYPETKTERNFAVQYKFSCPGHAIHVGFKTDNSFHLLSSSPDPQDALFVGRALALVDRDPSGTLRSTFDSNCELHILRSAFSLSDAVKGMLKTLLEESSIIAKSVDAFVRVSDAISAMAERLEHGGIEDLVWQRDRLRSMFAKVDFNALSARDRIVFVTNLRLLDEMTIKSGDDANGLIAKLNEIASETFRVIQNQQRTLLDRIAELKLRATELQADGGDMDGSEWAQIFANLNAAENNLN